MKPYSYKLDIQQIPFVAHFAMALGMPENTLVAKCRLRALFQTMREHMPLFASNALTTYLPRDMKPFFSEHWHQTFSTTFNYDDFINDLYAIKGMEHSKLFRYRKEAEDAVSAFFEVMKTRLTRDQYEDLMSLMPLCLRLNLMNDYVFEGHSYIF